MGASSVTGVGPGSAGKKPVYVSEAAVNSAAGFLSNNDTVTLGIANEIESVGDTAWGAFTSNPDAFFLQNALGRSSTNPTVYDPGSAAYPTITYDESAPAELGGKKYMMWYQGSPIRYTRSNDGITWDAEGLTSGLAATSDHASVEFDPSAPYSPDGSTFYKFQIWYWDSSLVYTISAIRTAWSNDGVTWVNDQVIQQDSVNKLVTGNPADWNYGTYATAEVLTNPLIPYGSARTPSNPMHHRYVMYYDGTNGHDEQMGLAFSNDGITFERWVPYAGANVPCLKWGGAMPPASANGAQVRTWDFDYIAAVSVVKVDNKFIAMYSGGDGQSVDGIGAAWSNDGIRWARWHSPLSTCFYAPNQVLNFVDQRSYTPEILFDANRFGGECYFKLWWSIKGSDTGNKRIAYTKSVI